MVTIGAAMVLVAGAAAGCGSSSSTSSTPSSKGTSAAALGGQAEQKALETLYKKAIAAGQKKVVIYGPTAGTDTAEYSAFEKSFPGITVSGVPVVGPPMTAKLSAEASSGKHVADIAYTGNTDMIAYGQAGYLAPFTPVTLPAASKLIAEAVPTGNDFYGVTDGVFGTVYNTSEVTAADVPITWMDLAQAKWKDKIAVTDPTAIGDMEDAFAHLALVPADTGLMADLRANDVQLFPASTILGPLDAVAQGAKELAPVTPYNFYLGAKANGAPVGFQLFKSDNYSVILYQGQIKGAPDPLASELYEDWMFTPQAASAIASEGAYSTVLGAAAPKGLPALSGIPLFPLIPLSGVTAADNAAIAKAKTYWG